MNDFYRKKCDLCEEGYHAPFERFDMIAAAENGPAFLMRCRVCGTMWNETLHSVKVVDLAEAERAFPGIKI